MISPLISYHWYGLNGKVKTSYDEGLIKAHNKVYVTKVLEDLNKDCCIITIQIPKTNVFDVLVAHGDDNYNDINNKINFMVLAMLQLANKKGIK